MYSATAIKFSKIKKIENMKYQYACTEIKFRKITKIC